MKVRNSKRNLTFNVKLASLGSHSIREIEITHGAFLSTNKEYVHGDNSDIVESDSHVNALYILAKKNGIKSPEEFGVEFCKHLLSSYEKIVKVFAYIEETTWDRISYEAGGRGHSSGFVNNPTCVRFTRIELDDEGRKEFEFFEF